VPSLQRRKGLSLGKNRRAAAIPKRARKQVSRLRKLARRTDIGETLANMVITLVQMGIDLPCRITLDDGTVCWVIDARRGPKTYDINTPDEAFMINITVSRRAADTE
jgi:hypothetical protein